MTEMDQRKAWGEVLNAVGGVERKEIGSSHEEVAEFLAKHLAGIGKKYQFEIAADIVKSGSHWGFKNLRSEFRRQSVSDSNAAIGWHNHPRGTTFSGYISAIDGKLSGDIANALGAKLKIQYIARSSTLMERFDPSKFVNATKGWSYDRAVGHKREVILNGGRPYVDTFEF
ncbi:hypothetical protein ACJJI3_01875 [Microbulbifer sp. ZKSA004]|uniref:hypothetical protein n=1 Tax=Microbulbifer sp. ZKSA004 TaxID=3243389 RepID=UPI00403944C8